MSAHARRCNEAARALLSKPLTSRQSRVEDGMIVCPADFVEVLDGLRVIENGSMGPWDTGIGNKDIETIVELGGLLVNSSFDRGSIGDVDLTGNACSLVRRRIVFEWPPHVHLTPYF